MLDAEQQLDVFAAVEAVTGAGRYYDCAVRLDGRWRCPLGGVPVGEADALSVVASA